MVENPPQDTPPPTPESSNQPVRRSARNVKAPEHLGSSCHGTKPLEKEDVE
jgi:hypothetical protein